MKTATSEYAELLRKHPELQAKIVAASSDEAPEIDSPEFSEDDLALRLSDIYASTLKYTPEWSKYHSWTGKLWTHLPSIRVFEYARNICREASNTADPRTAKKIASNSTVSAVEHLARSDSRHAMTSDLWDSNGWELNTTSGIVNLRTGKLLDHDPATYHTKITSVGPSDIVPSFWLKFLDRVTAGDVALQSFLKRMAGYSLTAETREEALFFLYGLGANGKSVFLNALSGIMHMYARVAPPEVFTVQKSGEKHPTALAGLKGSRLVTATETETGCQLAESQVKALTGEDMITARFMRGDYFDYKPTFKLLIAGNNKPTLRTVKENIRRRIHLIPFTVTIPAAERDLQLSEKLRKEWPGILSWAIDGCLEWQREGLNPPNAVKDATAAYLDEEDTLGRWLAECAVIGKRYETSYAALFSDWRRWTDVNNEYCGSQKQFSMNLEGRNGIQKTHGRSSQHFRGIALRSEVGELNQ